MFVRIYTIQSTNPVNFPCQTGWRLHGRGEGAARRSRPGLAILSRRFSPSTVGCTPRWRLGVPGLCDPRHQGPAICWRPLRIHAAARRGIRLTMGHRIELRRAVQLRRPAVSVGIRRISGVTVSDLELDLDVFQGPFDLLLALVMREEIELAELPIAEIVVAFVERMEERGEIDLESASEFLVLIAALLEIKVRLLFRARGLRRRGHDGRAGGAGADRATDRVPPLRRRCPLAARPSRGHAADVPRRPGAAAAAPRAGGRGVQRGSLAAARGHGRRCSPRRRRSTSRGAAQAGAGRPSSSPASARSWASGAASHSRRRSPASTESPRRPPSWRCWSCTRPARRIPCRTSCSGRSGSPAAAVRRAAAATPETEPSPDRPGDRVSELTHSVEALLFVASEPLSVRELAA